MSGTGDPGKTTYLECAAVAVTAVIPLVVVPGLAAPFSTPKIALLAAWVVAGGLVAIFAGRARFHFETATEKLAVAWVALVAASTLWGQGASLKALLIGLLPAVSFLLLTWIKPNPMSLASALVVSGSVVASISLAQYLGLDPFRLAGWHTGSVGTVRMRVYATLGNPNFVAALLSSILPLAWAVAGSTMKARLLAGGAALLMFLGILATGSRAPILGAAALAFISAWLFPGLPRRIRILGLASLILFGVLVAGTSVGRPVREALEGRIFIWRVTLGQAPVRTLLVGDGPGSFAIKYPEWETNWAASAPRTDKQLRFLGYQEHAHNDWLEVLIEQGITGLAVLLLILVSVGRLFKVGNLSSDRAASGSIAGIAIFCGLACVDFPFHRAAGSFVFWTLLAIVHLALSNAEVSYAESAVGSGSARGGCRNRESIARRV